MDILPYEYKGLKRCYNCQYHNHTSDTCSLNPDCVKWAEAQTPNNSKITT